MTSRKDIITEEEYTRKMRFSSLSPTEDSPGDSETDAGVEFQMGVDYMPEDTDEDEEDTSEEIAPSVEFHRIKEDELPESAKVISANQPSPWMDRERSSDTN